MAHRHYPGIMRKKKMNGNKIKKLSKKITSALKGMSDGVEFKIGVDVELVPKPCVKLFAHIYKLQKMREEKVKKDGSSKTSNESLQDNDEGVVK